MYLNCSISNGAKKIKLTSFMWRRGQVERCKKRQFRLDHLEVLALCYNFKYLPPTPPFLTGYLKVYTPYPTQFKNRDANQHISDEASLRLLNKGKYTRQSTNQLHIWKILLTYYSLRYLIKSFQKGKVVDLIVKLIQP